MKKITFFIGTLLEGGAERVVSILSDKIAEKGFEVEIVKYFDSENFYKLNENVKVLAVENETKNQNVFFNIKWLRKHFENSDLIISFLAPFNMLALYANKNNKTPIIVADRNDPNRIPNKAILRKIRNFLYEKYADRVIVQTNANKDYFSLKTQNKSVVIANPVTMYEYIGKALESNKTNTIVTVGRLMPQKNQLMLIDAFNELKNKYKDYKLIIYGEGSYREELEKRIDELNLNDSVILPGKQKDIFDKIKDAKLFVLSSDYEGMPNALIEAMCLGLPVISTKVSGANELIQDGYNGLLINNDKNELVNAIDRLLSDDSLREELGRNATKLNADLNVDVITDKWLETINEVL